MARYGVQWRQGPSDWWHDFPGSFMVFTDPEEAHRHYEPLLSSLRQGAGENAEFRAIKMPLHNAVELNW